jgi:hypothetical protein
MKVIAPMFYMICVNTALFMLKAGCICSIVNQLYASVYEYKDAGTIHQSKIKALHIILA